MKHNRRTRPAISGMIEVLILTIIAVALIAMLAVYFGNQEKVGEGPECTAYFDIRHLYNDTWHGQARVKNTGSVDDLSYTITASAGNLTGLPTNWAPAAVDTTRYGTFLLVGVPQQSVVDVLNPIVITVVATTPEGSSALCSVPTN